MANDIEAVGTGSLIIKYDGGRAADHVLTLDRYVESLAGWRDFFTIASEIYLRANPDLRGARREELFQLRIEAEREGSYEAALIFVLGSVAGGIIGNRADAAFVAFFNKLLNWYRQLIASHVETKKISRNVDQLVAALEAMTRSQGIEINMVPDSEELHVLGRDARQQEPDEDDLDRSPSPMRSLVDKLDTALRHAAAPIGVDCNIINVSGADRGFVLANFGAVEKAVLDEPLTMPLPSGVWNPLTVRFERINRKTGRALIYIDRETLRSDSASYARIMDPAVSDPGNIYAQAFTDDAQLSVWGRQVRAERGRLNLMWQISHKPPDQMSMFGPEGSRAS